MPAFHAGPCAVTMPIRRNTLNNAVGRACAIAAISSALQSCGAPNQSHDARLLASLRQISPAQITSLARDLGDNVSPQDFIARDCAAWNLTAADVQFFFQHAEPLTSADHHDFYYVLPCKWSGAITLDGKRYELEINAGSFAVVRWPGPPAGSALFGCMLACAKLFPFEVYDESEAP
jgi:hypothetical protein